MDMRKIFKSAKFWIGFFIATLAIIASVGGYVELPTKVKAIEEHVVESVKEVKEEIKENGDGLEKLSNTVEKYIAVQAEKEEGNDKRQKLLEQIVLNMEK